MPLPPDATPESHARLLLAEELASLCPPEIGAEIALAGSAARGWADQHSDIELNFWVDDLEPWPGERVDWLRGAGAGNIRPDADVHENGSRWIEFDYKGVPVEAGWHSFGTCESLLSRILAGEVTDMFQGYLAESLVHAIPLRNGEHLQRWRSWLEHYAEPLRRTMIEAAVQRWRETRFELDAAFVLRPEPALVIKRTDESIRSCLRILFAVNRQWEPDLRKWIRRWADTLALKPNHLTDRVYAIYEHPLRHESHADLLALIAETVELVPPEYELADVREIVAIERARWADQRSRRHS